MFADRQNAHFHRFRENVSHLFYPFQVAVNFPIQSVNTVIDNFSTHRSLVQENAKLREEMLFLKSHMQRMLAIENENNQLKQLLQSSANAGGRVLQGQILAVTPEPFLHQVIIDKGAQQGVYVGQPVLDAFGIMGQVIEVGPATSRVLLITDTKSDIPVQDSRSGVRSIAVGSGASDKLILANVTQTMDVKEGDLLMSSGLDERYPYGYPVGTVIKMKEDPAGQFLSVTVSPAAHLNRSRLIMLVWPSTMSKKR